MPKREPDQQSGNSKKNRSSAKTLVVKYISQPFKRFWNRGLWQKLVAILLSMIILFTGALYGLSCWYRYSVRNQPMAWGATFISSYAEHLGVDPHQTLNAIINDLGIKHLRLVSYWDEIEPSRGKYDFSNLDWQFKLAEKSGAKISLAVGLRQPRWPECHPPSWTSGEPTSVWYPQLYDYMKAVVNRYKNSPALDSYQLENEFFLVGFGYCPDKNRDRLIAEYKLLKSLDSSHTVIVTRSNNLVGFPVGQPVPDEYGVSVYKRVWDATWTHRYLEYPFPPWAYGSLAGISKILQGKDMMIHELQAEAWLPPGYDEPSAPVDELYKSFSPQILKSRIKYAKETGIKQVYLWGPEWWYQMKVKRNAPEIWDTAKAELSSVQ